MWNHDTTGSEKFYERYSDARKKVTIYLCDEEGEHLSFAMTSSRKEFDPASLNLAGSARRPAASRSSRACKLPWYLVWHDEALFGDRGVFRRFVCESERFWLAPLSVTI
jgi:hypothetical protein